VLSGTGNGLPGVPPAQLEGAAEETGVSKQVFSKEIPQGYRARQQGKAIEGAVQGSVIATYMHGPVLARNPQLADYLLSRVLGELEPLEPEIAGSDKLRSQRIRAAGVSE
jgi:adenosylcobyric acid synthase